MIYEFRKYDVAEGRMDELIERFKQHTLRLFERHDITPIIFSKDDASNSFSYVVSFPDKDSQAKSWQSFTDDEERVAIWDKSNESGKLVVGIESDSYEGVEF